jgi:hypothetical protein
MGVNVSIEREGITDKGNRVDIVIESDTRVILSENLIYAGVENPLDDYAGWTGFGKNLLRCTDGGSS